MWHVFNMRGEIRRVFVNEITRNSWVWVALVICLVLVLSAIYVPALGSVLALSDPGIAGWLVIVPASLMPLLLAPLASMLTNACAQRYSAA
jgi:Ca2+-transporting ATPase